MLWKEIRPQFIYRVRARRPISDSEIRVISHLYLPIVQANAYSLYLCLYHQCSSDHWVSGENSHQFLMQSLGLQLSEVIAAREKLEGVGLLSVYRYQEQDGFEYFLQPPLTPFEFFQGDVLSLLLLNRIGQKNYQSIREKYSLPLSIRFQEKVAKTEVTKNFNEVFTHLHLSEVMVNPNSETGEFLRNLIEKHPIADLSSRWESSQPPHYELDFECIEPLFSPEHRAVLFTEQNRRLMNNYAFRYGLNEEQIGMLLKDSYKISKKEWDINRFEELAKKLMRVDSSPGSQTEGESVNKLEPTNVEQHLANLKRISSIELLRNYQNGGQVSKPDKELIEYLLQELKLPEEVVNVLIDYILLTNDNKLPRAITEKIASSWKRKGFQTAEDAFTYAQEEYTRTHTQYSKKSLPTPKNTRNKRKQQVPEYIWLQVERDRVEEKEREKKQLETKVDIQEIDRLIEELEQKR